MAALTDWRSYLAMNPDLGKAGITDQAGAEAHWANYGEREGRQAYPGAPGQQAGITSKGTYYTPEQIKAWMTGKSDYEIAQQASSMGLTRTDISNAYNTIGRTVTNDQINKFGADNGFQWSIEDKGISSLLPKAAAPVAAPNPYAEIDAYMKQKLSENPGLTAQNYSPAVYGAMYQEAAQKYGVNGTFGSDGAAYYSSGLGRTVTPEEIKAVAATNPSDQQLLGQAQKLGWDRGTLASAMKSAGMNMADPKYLNGGVEYRLQDSLDRGSNGFSIGNGVGGHQAGNGAIVAGGGKHWVDDGQGGGSWFENGTTQNNGFGGSGGGYTQEGQTGPNAPNAYRPAGGSVGGSAGGATPTTPVLPPQNQAQRPGNGTSQQPGQGEWGGYWDFTNGVRGGYPVGQYARNQQSPIAQNNFYTPNSQQYGSWPSYPSGGAVSRSRWNLSAPTGNDAMYGDYSSGW